MSCGLVQGVKMASGDATEKSMIEWVEHRARQTPGKMSH
eukprot:COSAG05_NODE_420_length_9974_cov_12.733975_7_plen_39_part_00